MGHLIILRGPAGSGKSTVCTSLREIIGTDKTCSLDLDITGVNEDKFNENLSKCLSYENVVGMMFYGNSHTDQPLLWISRFKEKNYTILSIVLHASMDVCYKRCKNDDNPERPTINKQKETCNKYYNEFQQLLKNSIFRTRADIEEIIVDTENKSTQQIANEILRHLNLK